MLKSIFAVVLIAALGAAAVTTVVPYLEQVSADPDTKLPAGALDMLIRGQTTTS